ncbi:uncharacterized protein LOC141907065 [Tubulanus polymorphus]|uniref:uncharacterized protein LOC141907065 n=1 Tax=Tubulanus polymorphus TaxID=672921 RepID=UPI003DA5119F
MVLFSRSSTIRNIFTVRCSKYIFNCGSSKKGAAAGNNRVLRYSLRLTSPVKSGARHSLQKPRYFSTGSDEPPKDDMKTEKAAITIKTPMESEVISVPENYALDTNYLRGIPHLNEVEPHVYIDALERAIKSAPDTSVVLSIVSLHHKTMVKEHMLSAMESIYKTVRDMLPSERKPFLDKLMVDPTFQLLTMLVAKLGPFYVASDVLNLITYLSYLRFDAGHTVLQVFLELANHVVNDLRLHQLVHLGFVLGKMKPAKRTKVLHKLAAEAVRNNLFKELHLLDIRQLSNLLWIYGPDLATSHIEKVMEAILNQRESDKFTKPVMLLNVLRRNAIRDEIVTRVCLKKIRFQLKKGFLTLGDVEAVLEACRELQIYNFDTFNAIDMFLSHKNVHLPGLIRLLDLLVQCHFAPVRSLPKYIDLLKDDGCIGELLDGCTIGQLKMVISPLVMMNIRHADICSAVDIQCSKLDPDEFLKMPNKGLLLETSLYLLMLGCRVPWLPGLLDQLQAYISQDLQSADIWEEDKQDIVHKSSILLLLVKQGLVPDKKLGDLTWLRQALDYYSRWDILQKPLEFLFGGNDYVHNSVFHRGVLLDHLLMLDDHLQPVRVEVSNILSSPLHEIEALNLSQHSSADVKRVGVCVLDKRHFLENTGQLLGPYAQMVDTLHANGIHSLMVNQHCWRRVPEKEKLEYLKYKVISAAKEGHSLMFHL